MDLIASLLSLPTKDKDALVVQLKKSLVTALINGVSRQMVTGAGNGSVILLRFLFQFLLPVWGRWKKRLPWTVKSQITSMAIRTHTPKAGFSSDVPFRYCVLCDRICENVSTFSKGSATIMETADPFLYDTDKQLWVQVTTVHKEDTTYVSTAVVYSYLLSPGELSREMDAWDKEYMFQCNNSKSLIVIRDAFDSYDLKSNGHPVPVIYKSNTLNTVKTIKNVFIDKKEAIFDAFVRFQTSRDDYVRLGKPYTMGVVLYGPPGCGKTSFIKAVSSLTDRSIITVNRKVTTCAQLDHIMNQSPVAVNRKIFVFEDVDCMGDLVRRRDNVDQPFDTLKVPASTKKEKKGKKPEFWQDPDTLTLSYLLNVLDGLDEPDGRIVIMTTNCLESLDPALLRPGGRCDIKVRFSYCSDAMLKEMLAFYFEAAENLCILDTVTFPDGVHRPAYATNLCLSVCIDHTSQDSLEVRLVKLVELFQSTVSDENRFCL